MSISLLNKMIRIGDLKTVWLFIILPLVSATYILTTGGCSNASTSSSDQPPMATKANQTVPLEENKQGTGHQTAVAAATTRIAGVATAEENSARATRVARRTLPTIPIATPTTRPIPTDTSGIGVTRDTIARGMEETGFAFNPVVTRHGKEVVYGESIFQTSGGSIATLELTGPRNDIENAYFKVFDVNEAPQAGATYMLTFMELVLPDWRDGPNWLSGATKRAIAGDDASTRIRGHNGDVFIAVENNGMTMSIEISNREIINYADSILDALKKSE